MSCHATSRIHASPSSVQTRLTTTMAKEARLMLHAVARKHFETLRRNARSQSRQITVDMIGCPGHLPRTPRQDTVRVRSRQHHDKEADRKEHLIARKRETNQTKNSQLRLRKSRGAPRAQGDGCRACVYASYRRKGGRYRFSHTEPCDMFRA